MDPDEFVVLAAATMSSSKKRKAAAVAVVAAIFDSDSSEEEDELDVGAPKAPRTVKKRNFRLAEANIMGDYFDDGAPEADYFERRFRVSQARYKNIKTRLLEEHDHFEQKQDTFTRELLHSTDVKIMGPLRMLGTGCSTDSVCDYFKTGEETMRQYFVKFCEALIDTFGGEFLRSPTEQDLARLAALHTRMHNLPGMAGSLDCMHWVWKNCPKGWHGSFNGKEGVPTVVLEAVASQDCWIWHSFFGTAGANNDITVLERSPLFEEFFAGTSPVVDYKLTDAGPWRKTAYFLTDGIYPEQAFLVKAYKQPFTKQEKSFTKAQEAARKDVERAFGILQRRFQTLTKGAEWWSVDTMKSVMLACIILHNMGIEDRTCHELEQDADDEFWAQENEAGKPPVDMLTLQPIGEGPAPLAQALTFAERLASLYNRDAHHALRTELAVASSGSWRGP
jgi:hypothetical protein